jgi:hypothetical protein
MIQCKHHRDMDEDIPIISCARLSVLKVALKAVQKLSQKFNLTLPRTQPSGKRQR